MRGCTCSRGHVDTRRSWQVSSSLTPHLSVETEILLNLELTNGPDWWVSGRQGSACLSIPRTGITVYVDQKGKLETGLEILALGRLVQED